MVAGGLSFWKWFRGKRPARSEFRFHLLVVCRANITRSAFLEGWFRKAVRDRFPEVAGEIGLASAGVHGFRNAAPDPVIRYLASQRDIDLSRHASKPVSDRLVREADLILTLEEKFARQISRRFRDAEAKTFPLPMFGNSDVERSNWDIPDPTGHEAEAYDAFLSVAEAEAERILHLLAGRIRGDRSNLVLIGVPGAGMKTIGRALAEKRALEYVDVDAVIEAREGRSPREMADEGELQRLGEIEEAVIAEMKVDRAVVAAGAGAVRSTSAMTRLMRTGRVVYLEASPEWIRQRVEEGAEEGADRGPDGLSDPEIEAHTALCRRWAEVTLRVEELPAHDLISRVEEMLPR